MKCFFTLAFLSLGIALPAVAKPGNNCALAFVTGDSCKNLRVEFNLRNCGSSAAAKRPSVDCRGNSATASLEADKWLYQVKIKRFTGKNSSIWDVNGPVVASQVRAVATVTATAAASAAPQPTFAVSPAVSAPEFISTLKTNSLIQFWYVEDQSASAASADSNFRVRRAELKLTGSAAENTRWFLLADFAKGLATTSTSVVTNASPTTKTTVTGINTEGDSKILQDMGVAIKLATDLELTLGQFKLPTASESMQPTSELLFVDRALLTRTYGERRDPGLMLNYKYEKIKAWLATSNGQGPNVDEKNDRKDYSGRAEVGLPYGFNLGAFFLCKDAICYDPNRYGINLGWTYADLSLRGEYVNGNISSVRSTTYMFDAGYKVSEKWQLATRYETLQPDVASSFKSSAASVGVNYFLNKQNLKLQLNHTQLFNMRGNNGSYTSSADQRGSLIIFAIQNNF